MRRRELATKVVSAALVAVLLIAWAGSGPPANRSAVADDTVFYRQGSASVRFGNNSTGFPIPGGLSIISGAGGSMVQIPHGVQDASGWFTPGWISLWGDTPPGVPGMFDGETVAWVVDIPDGGWGEYHCEYTGTMHETWVFGTFQVWSVTYIVKVTWLPNG